MGKTKDSAAKMTMTFMVRFPPSEAADVRASADVAGLTVTEYIRRRIRGRVIVDRPDDAMRVAILKLGHAIMHLPEQAPERVELLPLVKAFLERPRTDE